MSDDEFHEKWGPMADNIRIALMHTAGSDGMIDPIRPSAVWMDEILSEHFHAPPGIVTGWKIIPLGDGVMYSHPEGNG